jgi:O-Antigen ligase
MKLRLKDDILVPLWAILLLLFRPSVIGENYNSQVFIIFFIVTVAILSTEIRERFSLSVGRIIVVVCVYICVAYFFIQGMILSDATKTVINSCVFLLMLMPCLVLILARHQHRVLQVIINFHVLLAVSAVITFSIFIATGFSIDRLPTIANLDSLLGLGMSDPSVGLINHIMFFPFTICWSTTGIAGIEIPRFTGMYREPGMAQIFLLTSFMLSYFIEVKHQRLKRILLLIASVLTFSAAGLVNLLVAVFFLAFSNSSVKGSVVRILKKPIVVLVGLVLFVVMAKQTYQYVAEKLDDISGIDRVDSFQRGWQDLMENPVFGKGYYASFKKDSEGVVVSQNFIGLPGVSYQLGMVGLFLYFLCWYFSLTKLGRRKTLCIYIPCLLTLALSQPSYNDVFSWFIIFLDTRNFEIQ